MKQYHRIPHWSDGPFGEKTIALDKKDGTSMRFEWNSKRGFFKFGTRGILINKSMDFGDGIDIFLNKYNESLNDIFRKKYSKFINIVVFAEYFGENSFAGQHLVSDKKDVCVFDISLYKRGIINPYEFQDIFGKLDIPSVIYEGEFNNVLINNVKNNIYNLKEGVVCKGVIKSRKDKDRLFFHKIKTNDWLNKVRNKLGERALLEELNGDINLFKV